MQDVGLQPEGGDEALAWRSRLALRLIRAFAIIFGASAVVIWLATAPGGSRNALVACALSSAALLTIPAITERPRGVARAWIMIVPALLTALMGNGPADQASCEDDCRALEAGRCGGAYAAATALASSTRT